MCQQGCVSQYLTVPLKYERILETNIKERGEHYLVSNFARIKNVHTGAIMKQTLKDGKYLCVALHYGPPKVVYVHKLVADAFPEVCGCYFEGAEVDHLNTNKTNNFFLNLRYVSSIENSNNPITRYHTMKHSVKAAIEVNRKPVLELNCVGEVVKVWESCVDIATHFCVNKSTVTRWIQNRKPVDGHTFVYKQK